MEYVRMVSVGPGVRVWREVQRGDTIAWTEPRSDQSGSKSW